LLLFIVELRSVCNFGQSGDQRVHDQLAGVFTLQTFSGGLLALANGLGDAAQALELLLSGLANFFTVFGLAFKLHLE